MKILLFVSSLYHGGMERIAAVLANHFAEKYDITVADFSDNRKTYPLDPRVELRDITPRCSRLFRPIKRLLNIKNVIKSVNPDVIISFSASLNAKVIRVNRLFKKRIIVSERTTVSRRLAKEAEHARKKLYPGTDCVVYVTKEDYDNSPHVKNRTFIYNPLLFEPYGQYAGREKSVVAIGGLNRWHVKGFDLLLSAWSKICPDFPDWQLEFLGTDADGPVHDMVENFGISKQVRFLGHSDSVQDVLRKKSVYVLSSRNEGFPNSLVEAMSQGCACIAFDCSTGPKEILTDGVSGLLVKNGSVEDMAEKMASLLSDENLRLFLSRNAVEEVKRFDYDVIMKQWDDLLLGIMNDCPSCKG